MKKWLKKKIRYYFKELLTECFEEGYRPTFKFEIIYPNDSIKPFSLNLDRCMIIGGIEMQERVRDKVPLTVAKFEVKEDLEKNK